MQPWQIRKRDQSNNRNIKLGVQLPRGPSEVDPYADKRVADVHLGEPQFSSKQGAPLSEHSARPNTAECFYLPGHIGLRKSPKSVVRIAFLSTLLPNLKARVFSSGH